MRNLKKFLALVLVMMMAFSLLVTVNAATTEDDFQDAYDTLAEYGIFNGVTGGAPSLTTPFTRAQMAAVAYRLATGDIGDEQTSLYASTAAEAFSDVAEDAWYAGYIGFCANYGIVVGHGDGTFTPNQPVTGAQASVMLLRLLGYGVNGEYEGTNWDDKALAQARRVNITQGLTDNDLKNTATRGVAAYLTLNGATLSDMVTYYYGDYYNSNGYPLVSAVSESERGYDDWGAPCTSTTTTVTFNWVQGGVTQTLESDDADEPLDQWWTPVSQATLYTAGKLSAGNATLAVYTNGVQGADITVDPAETSTTVNNLGGQGRWTRVYSDRIVYVDTFLSTVTNVVNEVKVNGKTAIPASYSTRTYYNDFEPATTNVATEGWTTAFTGEEGTIDFAKNSFFASYAIANEAPFTGDYVEDTKGIDELAISTAYAVREVNNVTVQAIIYSDGDVDTRTINGVQDSNGNRYLYNCTYSYNGGIITANDPTNGAGRLEETDINSVVTLYLDAHNNILGVAPATTSADKGVGVVTGYDAGRIKAGQYYGSLTVLLEDNTTTTIKFLDADGDQDDGSVAPYTSEDAASTDAEGYMGQLIYWVTDSAAAVKGYPGNVTIVMANSGQPVDVDSSTNTLEIGDSEALENASGADVLLNDDTVFFVANYQMQNSKGGYVFTGYTPYIGFQNLPRDLSLSDNSKIVDNTNPNVYASQNSLQVEVFDEDYATSITADNWATYVLVINAVNRTTNEVKPVPNYAFLADPSAFVAVYDNYYQYSAIMDGKANQPFRVDYNATASVEGTGLYTYSEYTNDGWARVTYLKGTNCVEDGEWGYTAGVLYYGGSYDPEAPDVSTANTFYTVAQSGCTVYIVDVTDGSFVTLNDVSLGNVQKAYPESDIWFELNQYGWIDTIYVVATAEAANPGQSKIDITAITFTVTDTAFTDLADAVTLGTTTTSDTNNSAATISVSWKKGVNGQWVDVPSSNYLESGASYRATITITPKSKYVMNLSTALESSDFGNATLISTNTSDDKGNVTIIVVQIDVS